MDGRRRKTVHADAAAGGTSEDANHSSTFTECTSAMLTLPSFAGPTSARSVTRTVRMRFSVGTGIRLPAESTPLRAWERVFGPASSGDAVGQRRRTTIDFAYNEYQELAPKIDATDRARLESHFGLVERLGHRLEGSRPCRAMRRHAPRQTSYGTTCGSTPLPTSSPRRSAATSRESCRSHSARCRRPSSEPTTSATRCTKGSPISSTTTPRSTPQWPTTWDITPGRSPVS